jgi:hypothetical protein
LTDSARHQCRPLDCLHLGSSVFVSPVRDTQTAIIFVHGFHGDPVKTWTDFQGLMDKEEHFSGWSRADVYFFTYDDANSSIDDSATALSHFIENIYPIPNVAIQALHENSNVKQYSKLIMVGHSEGAVVLRASIVEFGKAFFIDGITSPILDARLVLFAPAMFGFVPSKWLGVLAAVTGIRQFVDIYIAHSTAATEMRDAKSLQQVQADTEYLYSQLPMSKALVAHVIFGEDDDVVVKARYFQDRKYTAVRRKNHTTICKPTADYRLPLDLVVGA